MITHRATTSNNDTRRQTEPSRSLVIVLILISLLACSTACQKTEPSNSNANRAPANSSTSTNSATPSTPANANRETAASSESVSLATPTDAYRTGYAARKNKDIATLKRVFSKDALEFLTEIAQADKKTLDDQLMALAERPQAPTADVRNEKITGNRASLEYVNEKGKWVSMEFSKEGNEWKIDLPKGP